MGLSFWGGSAGRRRTGNPTRPTGTPGSTSPSLDTAERNRWKYRGTHRSRSSSHDKLAPARFAPPHVRTFRNGVAQRRRSDAENNLDPAARATEER